MTEVGGALLQDERDTIYKTGVKGFASRFAPKKKQGRSAQRSHFVKRDGCNEARNEDTRN
jgi:hypothetical protein